METLLPRLTRRIARIAGLFPFNLNSRRAFGLSCGRKVPRLLLGFQYRVSLGLLGGFAGFLGFLSNLPLLSAKSAGGDNFSASRFPLREDLLIDLGFGAEFLQFGFFCSRGVAEAIAETRILKRTHLICLW